MIFTRTRPRDRGVEPGSSVAVIVSLGVEQVEVPEVYGLSLAQAKNAVVNAGFNMAQSQSSQIMTRPPAQHSRRIGVRDAARTWRHGDHLLQQRTYPTYLGLPSSRRGQQHRGQQHRGQQRPEPREALGRPSETEGDNQANNRNNGMKRQWKRQ